MDEAESEVARPGRPRGDLGGDHRSRAARRVAGEDAELELRPGGDLAVRVDDGERSGFVEEVERAAAAGVLVGREGEESSRVEIELEPEREGTRVRVVESRPLADARTTAGGPHRPSSARSADGRGRGRGLRRALRRDPPRRARADRRPRRGERDRARARAPVSRQAINKHLASLAAAGLVADRRVGREVRYRVTPAPMSEAMTWMATVGGEWDARLAALRGHLSRA